MATFKEGINFKSVSLFSFLLHRLLLLVPQVSQDPDREEVEELEDVEKAEADAEANGAAKCSWRNDKDFFLNDWSIPAFKKIHFQIAVGGKIFHVFGGI